MKERGKVVYCLNCGQTWIISNEVVKLLFDSRPSFWLEKLGQKVDCCDYPVISEILTPGDSRKPKEFTLKDLLKKEL